MKRNCQDFRASSSSGIHSLKIGVLYRTNGEIHVFFMCISHLFEKHLEWGEIVAICKIGRLDYVLQHFPQVHNGTGKQSFNIYHKYNIRSGCVCLKEPLTCEAGTQYGRYRQYEKGLALLL